MEHEEYSRILWDVIERVTQVKVTSPLSVNSMSNVVSNDEQHMLTFALPVPLQTKKLADYSFVSITWYKTRNNIDCVFLMGDDCVFKVGPDMCNRFDDTASLIRRIGTYFEKNVPAPGQQQLSTNS